MATKRELAEGWLNNQLEAWKADLKRLRIGSSQELFNSFYGKVIAAAGDDGIQLSIAFAWYGGMVDAGLGRGTKSGNQADNVIARKFLGKSAGKIRRAKPWLSKGRNGLSYQTQRLASLIGRASADETVDKIYGSIALHHTITFR
jgi:hypothetical protein